MAYRSYKKYREDEEDLWDEFCINGTVEILIVFDDRDCNFNVTVGIEQPIEFECDEDRKVFEDVDMAKFGERVNDAMSDRFRGVRDNFAVRFNDIKKKEV